MQLTEQNAKAYVLEYFAKANKESYDSPVECEVINVQPCDEIVDDVAFDVMFRLSDCPELVSRFTVWIERYPNVAPFIYGEW